jgi:hypothetical protein
MNLLLVLGVPVNEVMYIRPQKMTMPPYFSKICRIFTSKLIRGVSMSFMLAKQQRHGKWSGHGIGHGHTHMSALQTIKGRKSFGILLTELCFFHASLNFVQGGGVSVLCSC